MSRVWRRLLRWLGLSGETRVHITAPGLDVVISGEPRRVRRLLTVVTDALETETGFVGSAPSPSRRRKKASDDAATMSQVVLPSDLDEMDSPYAPLVREPKSPSVKPRSAEQAAEGVPSGDWEPRPAAHPGLETTANVAHDPKHEATFEIPGRSAARFRRQLETDQRGPGRGSTGGRARGTDDDAVRLDRPKPSLGRSDGPERRPPGAASLHGSSARAPIPRAPSLSLRPFDPPTALPPDEVSPEHEHTPVDESHEPDPERTAVELSPLPETESFGRAQVEVTDGRVPADVVSDATIDAPLRLPRVRRASDPDG